MKKSVISVVSMSLIICVLVSVLAVASKGFTNFDLFKKNDPVIEKIEDTELKDVLDEFGNKINDGFKHAFTSKMNFSQAALTASEGKGVAVLLEATVLPVSARNKMVDWSVAWQKSSSVPTENVANFVKIVPLEIGSTTAEVTCKKAFSNNIEIKVTTREGGYSAVCVVSFSGRPTSMDINIGGNTSLIYDEYWGVDIVNIYYTDNIVFDFKLNNVYNSVNDNERIYKCDIKAFGIIDVMISDTRDADVFKIKTDVLMNDLIYPMHTGKQSPIRIVDYILRFDEGTSATDIFTISYLYPVEEFSAEFPLSQIYVAGYEKVAFWSYQDWKVPYFELTITEEYSGVSQTINIRGVSTAKSVVFGDTTLEF